MVEHGVFIMVSVKALRSLGVISSTSTAFVIVEELLALLTKLYSCFDPNRFWGQQNASCCIKDFFDQKSCNCFSQ